jgi:hypothetical protein
MRFVAMTLQAIFDLAKNQFLVHRRCVLQG